jgi:hypothetical protein
MPTQTLTTMPILPESIPVGADFVGGGEPLPVRPAGPAEVTQAVISPATPRP